MGKKGVIHGVDGLFKVGLPQPVMITGVFLNNH